MTIKEIDSEGSRRFERWLSEFDGLNHCKVRDNTQDGLRAQLEGIDYVCWRKGGGGREVYVELKTEAQNKWGNFYFETIASKEPYKPGWILGCPYTHILAYQFLDTRELFWMDLTELRGWLFGTDASARYPLKPQRKHATRHTAYGLCTPIRDVEKHIEVQRFTI